MKSWILVTGFGPFPGVDLNPTETIARCLDGQRIGGGQIRSEVLEVSYDRVAERLRRYLEDPRPLATVHLGVAVTAREVRLECQAVNLKNASIPDASGVHCQGVPIRPSEPLNFARQTTVPTDAFVQILRAEGFAVRTSDDAGRYVCNCAYYHALSDYGPLGIPSLFIHLPPVGSAPMENESATWTSDRLRQVVERLVTMLIQHLQPVT